MDLQNALHIFNTLYSDINGYSLSTQGRAQITSGSKAFTYGEINPEAFYKILKEVVSPSQQVFYDLGSGTGKAVILATLLFDFQKSIGIEYLEPLEKAAEGVLARYKREIEPTLPDKKQKQEAVFVNEDFLQYDFSDGDIIFTHSTCFPEELWTALIKKCEQLKKGTVLITVTRTVDSPFFEEMKSQEYGMGWGRATVHFYRKV